MSAQYISICPISVGWSEDDWADSRLPLKISDSLYVEDVSEIVRNTSLNIFVPQFYSQEEVDAVKQTRYALVRHFECDDQGRPDQDEESARVLYRLYLGLKVIRPTAGRYQVFHYDMSQSIPRLPRGSRNDHATILCECELLNCIRWIDLQELAAIAPSSSEHTDDGGIAHFTSDSELGDRLQGRFPKC